MRQVWGMGSLGCGRATCVSECSGLKLTAGHDWLSLCASGWRPVIRKIPSQVPGAVRNTSLTITLSLQRPKAPGTAVHDSACDLYQSLSASTRGTERPTTLWFPRFQVTPPLACLPSKVSGKSRPRKQVSVPLTQQLKTPMRGEALWGGRLLPRAEAPAQRSSPGSRVRAL